MKVSGGGEKSAQTDASKWKKKNKNMKRLGGASGLSLETFANLKSRNNGHNPSLIKKQREFYKNAKYIGKYKKSLKQHNQQNDPPLAAKLLEGVNEAGESSKTSKKYKKSSNSLKELYEHKHEEEEKARIEREAIMQAKNEERAKSEAKRKATRDKMLKKTRFGQPVMKYRIEHLLETIQSSNKNP